MRIAIVGNNEEGTLAMKKRLRSANPYMSVETASCKVVTYYSEGPITSVEAILSNQDGKNDMVTVTVTDKNGKKHIWSSEDVYFTAFVMYGISISKDGRFLFAQQDMNGLKCLDLHSGKLIWKTKTRAEISHIFVRENAICCSKSKNEILLFDIETGEVLLSRKAAYDNRFEVLTDKYILLSSSSKCWEVIDGDTLGTVETIEQREFDKDPKKMYQRLYNM